MNENKTPIQIFIKIKSANGVFTQIVAGGIPQRFDGTERPFELAFDSTEEGLCQVLHNVGAVFLKSQNKDEASFMASLKNSLVKCRNVVLEAIK